MIAWGRNHSQTGAIFLVTLLVGWSGIGWIAVLIWAFVPPMPPETAAWAGS
jgi:hypothetical protein